jgi:hypothetical protein
VTTAVATLGERRRGKDRIHQEALAYRRALEPSAAALQS